MVGDYRNEFVLVGRIWHACDRVKSMFFQMVHDILLECLQVTVLLELDVHSFGPMMLTFSLGRNGGGPTLVGFYRFGTWILKSSPVLVRFASGPCDPSILGYLCNIPKLGHCRFECCLWWRCRRLIAFGRLIPRSLLLAWGLRELCVLVLCHLAQIQTVMTQLLSYLSPSG